MMLRSAIIGTGLLIASAVVLAAPAQALTMKECGDKYQAAKTGNTLNGLSWNDFRKAQCGTEAAPAAATPAAPAPATTTAKPAPAPSATTAAKPAPAATASGNAVFPSAIDPKYAKESAGKQRMHTCLDQYNANKASNGNGGLKWIQKGGGYYSECNKKLKS
ncbi:hypothetical protein FZC33_12635 [Labrys sp. KNU-23]|uniref:hypothetical protein n=1 Tax=Labrys sp. KNU-23 TaxID=2789216 RepID=UPI0011EBB461|nr:hypothetical protein [Labrys sp. KNU-23]QEN87122.1 hypothetical protein FZC33_12635 [Labrys sp. KNU-23]